MSDKDSGPEAGTKGVVEGVKGKAKEAVGAITGKEELRREGDRKYVAVLADHFETELPVSREKLNPLKAALGLEDA